jgi:cytochrome c-type biogenesis protein
MELYQLIVLPIAFGLLGFVEPCSIGANIIFPGYLQARDRAKMLEAVKFTVTRALFLGLIGLAAGVLGQSLRIGTYSYSIILGLLYPSGFLGSLVGL